MLDLSLQTMPNAIPRFLILLMAVSFFSGCGFGGKVAAVVNGRVITVKEVDDRLASMNPPARSAYASQKGRLLDQMVVETVLLQEAQKRGLSQDAEVRKLMGEAQKQILVGRLLDVLRKEKQPQVSDGQVSQFYEANKDKFQQPDSYHVSHILTADEESAKKGIERLKTEPFAKVAEEVSIDPSKSRGGDIGFFSKGQVIPEFEEAVMKLQPGQTSGIVKTPLGYHIITLAEKKPAHLKSLDEVKDQIRQILQNQQGQQAVQSVVEELRSKSKIKIKENFAASQQQPAS